jgi:glycosyltransferase involved in cell wall biosynthesis
MTPLVSVVVPTYRRHDLLERCLAALAQQDLAPAEYEIIVADDGCSDDTQRQVESWAKRAPAPVRYVRPAHHRGPASARNAGWRAAAAPVIAFTDDDTIPDPGWLRAGLQTLTSDVAAVWGRVHVPLPDRPSDYERNESHLQEAGFVTANCFCRHEALAAVGGFDERFTMAWREDSDLHFTLLERGYLVRAAPQALVVHPVRPGAWAISLKQQRKSIFNALLYKKHPELYRQVVQPTPPIHYYAIDIALLACLFGFVAGDRTVGIAAGAIWLLLTAAFCLRRLCGTSLAPRHIAEMVFTSALIPPVSTFWRLRGAVRFRVPFV